MTDSIYTQFLNAFSDAWRLMIGTEWTANIVPHATEEGRHVMAWTNLSCMVSGSFSVWDKHLTDPGSAYQIVADIAEKSVLLEEMYAAYNKGNANG